MKIFYFRRSRIFASIACVAVLAAVAVVSSISPAEEAAAMTGGYQADLQRGNKGKKDRDQL